MSTLPRPPQTTFLAGVVIGGGVLVVLNAFSRISRLRTLEVRDALAEAVDGRYSGLGLSVSDLQTVLHVTSMISAACAVAMAILGWFVLQRSHSARVGLAVLAVPLTISTVLTLDLDLIAPIVVMASVMLWMQPSRDWFNGVAPRPAPEPAPEPDRRSAAPVAPPSYPAAPVGEARPYAGFGAPTTASTAPPSAAPATAARPAAVVWACALTWATSGLVGVAMALVAVAFAAAPDELLDELRRQDPALADDLSEDWVVRAVVTAALVFVVWCVAAAVLAWFAFRRAAWAQVALLVSAALAGAVCLLGTLGGGGVLMLAPLAASSVAFAALLRPEVRRWYHARGAAGS